MEKYHAGEYRWRLTDQKLKINSYGTTVTEKW
jgi:hypothetical protein